jgi:hypothetical protein
MPDVEIDNLLLIVVGSQVRCEVFDRPLAARLQAAVAEALDQADAPLAPLVCTDVLYLNTEPLQGRPAISVGGPGVNALSAYLYPKLPTVLSVEDQYVVQMETDAPPLRAALWGAGHEQTALAIDAFTRRYLPVFLDAIDRA